MSFVNNINPSNPKKFLSNVGKISNTPITNIQPPNRFISKYDFYQKLPNTIHDKAHKLHHSTGQSEEKITQHIISKIQVLIETIDGDFNLKNSNVARFIHFPRDKEQSHFYFDVLDGDQCTREYQKIKDNNIELSEEERNFLVSLSSYKGNNVNLKTLPIQSPHPCSMKEITENEFLSQTSENIKNQKSQQEDTPRPTCNDKSFRNKCCC
jgi:hypothetical protein